VTNKNGGFMRDYTFIDGARFSINNLYRSLRFDVDRLDMSYVEGEKPAFTRGLRIVDNDEMNTVRLDGEEADNLIYSLTLIYSKEDGETFRGAVDAYLLAAVSSREYLVTAQKKEVEGEAKVEGKEAVLH